MSPRTSELIAQQIRHQHEANSSGWGRCRLQNSLISTLSARAPAPSTHHKFPEKGTHLPFIAPKAVWDCTLLFRVSSQTDVCRAQFPRENGKFPVREIPFAGSHRVFLLWKHWIQDFQKCWAEFRMQQGKSFIFFKIIMIPCSSVSGLFL